MKVVQVSFSTGNVLKPNLHNCRGYQRCLYNLHEGDNDFLWFSQHWNGSLQASHNLYTCRNSILAHSWFRNTTAQPPQDRHESENDYIWSSQHWNRTPWASYNLYSCGNFTCGHSLLWNTPVQPTRQWKRHYLIFSALKLEFTSIAQPLHLA